MTEILAKRVPLTADLVFARLDELRELLRLTDYLRGFRPSDRSGGAALEREVVEGEPVVVLYRPTGAAEMDLVERAAFARWPPRLDEQPIFYPVTNLTYAHEIAAAWNAPSEGVAFVTRFRVRAHVVERYPVQIVGASHHTELWVPSEDLAAFNDAIVGPIEIVERLHRGRD